MKYEIKKMALGGIVDQGLAVVKSRFLTLFGITLFLYVPFSVLSQAVLAARSEDDYAGTMLWTFGSLLISLCVIMPLTNAAVIRAVSNEYLGADASAGGAMKSALSLWGPVLATSILKGILVFLGFVFFIIPGIYLSLCYLFSTEVVVLEGRVGMAALNRSRRLMRTKGTFGLAISLGLAFVVIGFGLGWVGGLVPSLFGVAVAAVLAQTVAFLLMAGAWVVFYFSARCSLENFDLVLLAEAVGQSAPAEGDTETRAT